MPLHSMTAFSHIQRTTTHGSWTVQIQGVNRRFLEVTICLPPSYVHWEPHIRKCVAAKIGRGAIQVQVQFQPSPESTPDIRPQLSVAKAWAQAWEEVAHALHVETPPDLRLLFQQPGISISSQEHQEEWEALEKMVGEALDLFCAAKQREGAFLEKDILHRVEEIERSSSRIEQIVPLRGEQYRNKWEEKRKLFFGTLSDTSVLGAAEFLQWIERMDITEELVRLRSHLQQFRTVIEKPEDSLREGRGKQMEFWLQELHREITTLGAKAMDTALSQEVVRIKTELEKIREQIQNIE